MDQFLMVILLFQIIEGAFYANRIKPGRFEYPKLNGWMLLDEAKKKCDEDLACGGFTFKGSFKTKELPMEIYFFHVVPSEEPSSRISGILNFSSVDKVRYILCSLWVGRIKARLELGLDAKKKH